MTMRNPAHDPVRGDVLAKYRDHLTSVDVLARRTVVDGKAGTAPYYVEFMDSKGRTLTTGLPAWRKWAKDAVIEHMATSVSLGDP